MIRTKWHRALSLLLCLGLLVAYVPAAWAAEEEEAGRFIENGGFEEVHADGTIPGWKVISGLASVSGERAFEGSNSLFVQNASGGAGIHMESALIDVEEGETYTLTGNIFLEEGAFEGFYVYVYDEAGELIHAPTGSAFQLYVNHLSPQQEWTLVSGSFTVPAGGKKAKVSIISGNRKNYQVFIDNVSMLKAVENGGFEEVHKDGTIPGWGKFAPTDGGNFAVTEERAASGIRSLVIENDPGFYMNVIGSLIPVEAGETYTAMAKTFIETGQAGMYVRYFNADGVYLGKQHWSIVSEPADVWFTNVVIGEAPEDASYAAVMFAGSNSRTYQYFVDDVTFVKGAQLVEEEPQIPDDSIVNVGEDLGVQIRKATIMRGDAGKDANGRDVLYTVVQGSPAMFTVIDIETEQVVHSAPMPDTSGAWSVKVSSDGTVYLGAYNLGLLYRYFPETGELVNLGHPLPSKDSVLYPMDTDPDGNMYGGTYPTGSVYQYDPETNTFTDFGTMAHQPSGERWARVTVYDAERDKLYVGVGNTPRLVEYDIATGAKRDLLPEGYENITAVYDLDLVGGKLFARKETTQAYEYFVIDPVSGEQVMVTNGDTGEVGEVFINYSRGVSPKSPVADKMYFAGLGGELFEYDLASDTYRSLGVSIEGAAISYDFVQLEEEGFPGWSLVGLSGNNGKMYKYNLETGNVKIVDLMLPAEPVNIHAIETGPDGHIYTAGYLAGNLGMYNTVTGESRYYNGIGQGEGMTVVGNSLFIGVYPDARIYEYDLSKPWNRDNPDFLNPDLLFSLYSNDDIPGYTLQDRPFGMAGSEELGKLFVGTVPKNGMLGGALAVYDLHMREEPDVYWNVVEDQSILSLVYADGLLYGGTSIHGGQGSTPTASEAVLFVWDAAAGEKVFETVPVPGNTAITALHAGPDGNIWGLANGALFVFDPVLREVVYSRDVFPGASGRWIDGSMVTGTDGNIYATVDEKFFKVDVATKEVTVLATQARHVAQDAFGHFYLYAPSGTNLYRYTIPELILPLTGAKLTVPDTFVRVGETMPVTVTGILGGGERTVSLKDADVEYLFSKRLSVRVEPDGSLTALRPGSVEIAARVTLGGVTVTTSPVRVVITPAADQAG